MKLPNALHRTTHINICSIIFLLLFLAGCGGGSESSPHLNWTSKATMPTARTNLSSGMVYGKIYAIGGYTGSYSSATIVDTVEEYDPASDTWATMTSMPTARKGLASAVVGNIIYAIGGAGNCKGNCGTVEAYDSAHDLWMTTQLTPMPTQRNGMSAVAVSGVIYVMGGCCAINSANASIDTVEAYDTATNKWTTMTPMPTAREGLTSAVVNNKIYAIGGGPRDANSNTTSTDIVEEYNPALDTWTTKAPMPTSRRSLASAVVNGKIYAIGGAHGTSPAPAVSTVEVYDPVANTWLSLSSNYSMPTARGDFTSEVVNGIIYAIGATSLGTVEAFIPP